MSIANDETFEVCPRRWRFAFVILAFPLLLLGKSYFVFWGSIEHLKPLAPLWAILFKDVLILILLCGFLARLIYMRYRGFQFPSVFAPTAALSIAFFAITIFHWPAMSSGEWLQHYFRNVVLLLPTIALFNACIEPNELRRFFNVLLGVSLINAIFAILAYVTESEWQWNGRAIALMADPIILASLLVLASIVVLTRLFSERFDWFKLFTLALLLIALWLTESLTFIAIFVILFLLLLSIYYPRAAFAYATLGGGIVIYALATGRIPGVSADGQNAASKIVTLIKDPTHLYSFVGRINSYNRLFEFFETHRADELLLGELSSGTYTRADSTLSVLIMNYGLLGTAILLIPSLFILIQLTKIVLRKKSQTNFVILWLALLSLFLGSFLNSIIYRYPLNLMIFAMIGIYLRIRDAKPEPLTSPHGSMQNPTSNPKDF